MRTIARYSFNGGERIVQEFFARELAEVEQAIRVIETPDADEISSQRGKAFVAEPRRIRRRFREALAGTGWRKRRVRCAFSPNNYLAGYRPHAPSVAYRELPLVKNGIGFEPFFQNATDAVCSLAAKMTIFRNLGVIKAGIEVVPVKEFATEMSSGVSYFEQFVWDLEKRGIADIDVPVLILGITG